MNRLFTEEEIWMANHMIKCLTLIENRELKCKYALGKLLPMADGCDDKDVHRAVLVIVENCK